MDRTQYSTLLAAVSHVPDPRHKKGQRFSWSFLLSVILAAVASDPRAAHAIAHWVSLHADELREGLHPPRPEMPSESTLKRVLRHIDVAALERHLSRFAQTQDSPTVPPAGLGLGWQRTVGGARPWPPLDPGQLGRARRWASAGPTCGGAPSRGSESGAALAAAQPERGGGDRED